MKINHLKKGGFKMDCINCGNKKFDIKKVRMETLLKEDQLEVIAEAFVCTKCRHEMMNTEQMANFRVLASDTYRKKHELLTSNEIVSFRKKMAMTQTEFAKYLGVGEASVKRWESHHIQDESQNELIRLKCDELYAIKNMLNIEWKSAPSDEFSGNRKFNINTFTHLVLHLLSVTKSPIYLNKALFYVDFKNFQKFGKSVTGARYVALDYGPCPDQFKEIYRYLEEHKFISRSGKHDLKALRDSHLSIFDDKELEVIKDITERSKKDGGKEIFELSHKEIAFTETTKYIDYISYLKSSSLLV